MNTYKVMQNRGCGISYEECFGTLKECVEYIKSVAVIDDAKPKVGVHYTTSSLEEVNGDNQQYDYSIERVE